MTRKGKELMWTAMALTGIGLGALVATQVQGEEPPLKGPEVKQEGERPRARGEGEMRPEGQRGPGGEMRPGDRIRHLLEGIELTDEQREKIKVIVQEGAEKAKAFREEHQAEFEQLRKDMQAAREAQDREKMRELGQKHRELIEKGPRNEIIEQIKAVLTPEQIATLEANIAKEREQMKNREGQGPRREGMSPEQREKLEKMSPEEREKFMQQQRERRQEREGQKREGQDKGEKLDI